MLPFSLNSIELPALINFYCNVEQDMKIKLFLAIFVFVLTGCVAESPTIFTKPSKVIQPSKVTQPLALDEVIWTDMGQSSSESVFLSLDDYPDDSLVLARAKTWSSGRLFPLYGAILGQTTQYELRKLGGVKDKDYNLYVINGINFWYDENSNIFDHMYIVEGMDEIPKKWKKYGFDWDLSYLEWLALLKNRGFSIIIKDEPKVSKYDGHDSFSAEIIASKTVEIPIEIELDFNYSHGTSTTSKATLYSISVRYP